MGISRMSVSWSRIKGVVRLDYYITKGEMTIVVDLVFFSVINVVVFGLIAEYLAADSVARQNVLLGMVLWEIIRVCQYSVSLLCLWNAWSRNLSNLFISPMSLLEFGLGCILSSVVKTFLLVTPLVAAIWLIFDLHVWQVGLFPLLIGVTGLLMFASSVGLVLIGWILKFGVRIQAVAWSAIYLFQPIMGVYFPAEVLPRPLQYVAYLIPASHLFEGMRNAMIGNGSVYGELWLGLGMNVALMVLCAYCFKRDYFRSRVSGQLARNDA